MRSEILLVSYIDENELTDFVVNETKALMETTNAANKLMQALGIRYASKVDMASGAHGGELT